MVAITTMHQRLVSCCRDPLDGIDNSFAVLKGLLNEISDDKKRYLIDVEDETNRAPVFHAIESAKPLDFVRQLLDFPVRLTHRIVFCAVRYGTIETLQLLHQYGADFRQPYHGISVLHECILQHKNHLIRFLIDHGNIDLNVVDHDNQTPLLYAIFRTNLDAINILLSYAGAIDPCAISTRTRAITCFHAACELGIDDILPSMIQSTCTANINKLSQNDQTPFDLFLSCYLFTKNNLYMNDVSLERFSSLFDLFVANGAKLHHLTRAYRRTRAPYVTKILTILLKKPISFHEIILQPDSATIAGDLQSIICQSLGDWPYLLESSDSTTPKQRQMILRQLYELFTYAYYKSINRQPMNTKLLTRCCAADGTSSVMKRILWLFIENLVGPTKQMVPLKSICRKEILRHVDSIDERCTSLHLHVSKQLEQYLLFFAC